MTRRFSLNKKYIALFAGVAIVIAVALFLFVVRRPEGDRRVFYFPSYDDDKIHTEVRFLPSESVQGDVRLFVDELLLGPLTNRYRILFSQGTRVRSCMQNDSTLYLDLSEEALFNIDPAPPVDIAADILEKNIKQNFSSIKTVEVFIDGKKIYENPQ
jgi:hypothetical protein